MDAPPPDTLTHQRPIALKAVRRMFEGVIPAVMCSASAEGIPHLCFLSQVDYVDEQHVALSFQFFNRSRENVLATRHCVVSVDDPDTAAGVQLQLRYLRTETSGPVFERMKAKLAGIAAHMGMEKIYRLQGADIYEVLAAASVAGRHLQASAATRCDIQAGTRAVIDRISACTDMAQLFDHTLQALREHLLIHHSMILLRDTPRDTLYTVASLGYESSGVGAEIPMGQGLAGIAARENVPLRIGHLAQWKTYTRAISARTADMGLGENRREEIPLPGLAEPRSQLVVPLRLRGQVIGVLLAESQQDRYFSYDDEDALVSIAAPLALGLSLMQPSTVVGVAAIPDAATATGGHPHSSEQTTLTVSHYAYTHSVFLDKDYLIKGVAGAILWRLLRCWQQEGRREFSNRELRLDASLGLPDVTDNLGARLILLQRRLAERQAPIQIVRTGRGRFRLEVQARLILVEQT